MRKNLRRIGGMVAAGKRDWSIALSKGALGAIPVVGPLAAEVVGVLIPNQRLDRLERFLAELERQVEDMDSAEVHRRFENPEFVDLLEDGLHQAARALNEERLAYIASIVANGLSIDDVEHLRLKKMMSILGSLNDAEILVLVSYGRRGEQHAEFLEQHRDILRPKAATLGSSDEEAEVLTRFRGQPSIGDSSPRKGCPHATNASTVST